MGYGLVLGTVNAATSIALFATEHDDVGALTTASGGGALVLALPLLFVTDPPSDATRRRSGRLDRLRDRRAS